MRQSVAYLLSLLMLVGCSGRSGRMLALLEQAEWMNRNDSLFQSDSIGRLLVDYYDHWWQPDNLRLRAYYMLGCAYRDMGEAPAALHYYNMAVERADTLHTDSATSSILFRVYGQMAMIYGQQNMPYEELSAFKQYGKYALLANDTINHILGYELQTGAYYRMDDTINVLKRTRDAYQLYLNHGDTIMAARTYPTAIYVLLSSKKFSIAKKYMNIFENKSGLFDEYGNIENGREIYYYSKVLLYLGINKLDSAEFYCRKLIKHGYPYEGNKGLLAIYTQKKNVDSIIKYSPLMESALLEWATRQQFEAIIQSSAMYKYERNQSIAEQKAKDAKVARYFNMFLAMCFLLITLLSYIGFHHAKEQRRKKEMELQELERQYSLAKKEYTQKCEEFELLQLHYEIQKRNSTESINAVTDKTRRILERMNDELKRYKTLIENYENKMGFAKASEIEDILKRYIVIKKCRAWVEQKSDEKPTHSDFDKIIQIYEQNVPQVYKQFIEAKLSYQEQLICILLLLNFDSYQITNLLEKAPQSITNSKANANRKLFKEKGAETLLRHLKKLVRCNVM